MTIAAYIREIGRGKDGARALDEAQAHDLMSQVLDGRVSDLELGAFVLAMRIKGETVDELAGFLKATHERCLPVPADDSVVWLPSYNGARKLPNLTPLLALLLAQEGARVLVHGPMRDPARIGTADIFRDLGLPFATNAEDVVHAWARHEPVFVALDDLCPPLARLLEVRRTVGLRNSGHTVAKLLAPGPAAAGLRMINYTHPEYATLLRSFAAATGANAVLMRGTEGEPVADPRRSPRLDVYLDGVHRPELSRQPQEGVLSELPVLPREHDAATTALYIQSVVSGEKPAPAPIVQQVDCLMGALASLGVQDAHASLA